MPRITAQQAYDRTMPTANTVKFYLDNIDFKMGNVIKAGNFSLDYDVPSEAMGNALTKNFRGRGFAVRFIAANTLRIEWDEHVINSSTYY